uniref:Solute carrier organic anion transporter family member 4A1-like n=1 Tax=Phallusia mammillata TaxID=59560 RepID=A0A6F9DSD1_9ASCI|nr:solute carrier organic anion transporter family member 4A1-like [Phallusia mammillata]
MHPFIFIFSWWLLGIGCLRSSILRIFSFRQAALHFDLCFGFFFRIGISIFFLVTKSNCSLSQDCFRIWAILRMACYFATRSRCIGIFVCSLFAESSWFSKAFLASAIIWKRGGHCIWIKWDAWWRKWMLLVMHWMKLVRIALSKIFLSWMKFLAWVVIQIRHELTPIIWVTHRIRCKTWSMLSRVRWAYAMPDII